MLLEIISAVALLAVAAVAVVVIRRVARQVRVFFCEAYSAGYRRALRDAISVANQRADIAAEIAPTGKLGQGLVRAQIAREVALELQRMLEVAR